MGIAMKTPLVFFGNERIATGVTTDLPLIKSLLQNGFEIEYIVVNQSSTHSGRKHRQLEIESFAHKHNIELFIPQSKEELHAKIASSKSQIAVLAAYGKIIPEEIINAFEFGIVNLHPSLLPKYRGPTPLESFILSGESQTGVSIMSLSKGMDDGPVYTQETFTPSEFVSKQALADELGKIGGILMPPIIESVLSGKLQPQPQTGEPTYTNIITKDMAHIDTSKPAIEVERSIRAYKGWPGNYIKRDTVRLYIIESEVISTSGTPGEFFIHEKQLAFYCQSDAILIKTIKPEGKKEMASRDYLLGHPLV